MWSRKCFLSVLRDKHANYEDEGYLKTHEHPRSSCRRRHGEYQAIACAALYRAKRPCVYAILPGRTSTVAKSA